MLVSDGDHRILYCDPFWPGSVPDARVMRRSALQADLDLGRVPFEHAVFLADSGYTLTQHVLTPILGNNLTPAEDEYNRRHRKTRCSVFDDRFPNFLTKFLTIDFLHFSDFCGQSVRFVCHRRKNRPPCQSRPSITVSHVPTGRAYVWF